MTQTQRSSMAARTRGLIQAETLENRRLFAGLPYGGSGHGGHGQGGDGSFYGGRPWADAVVVALAVGGKTQAAGDSARTTNGRAFADAKSAVQRTAAATAESESTASATVPPVIAPPVIPLATLAVTNRDAPVANRQPDQQVMPDRVPSDAATQFLMAIAAAINARSDVATQSSSASLSTHITPAVTTGSQSSSAATEARSAVATKLSTAGVPVDATAAVATLSSVAVRSVDGTAGTMASEPDAVFGPFTLGPAAVSARRPFGDGVGSLLTLSPDAVDRSLRWQAQDATYRPRRAASPTTTTGELPADLAQAAVATTVDQAGLAPVAAEMATRPLWQRAAAIAAIAAGGLLVAANVLVRRRRTQQVGVFARR